jgi:hypothetical protein
VLILGSMGDLPSDLLFYELFLDLYLVTTTSFFSFD